MNRQLRALVVDDDVWSLDLVAAVLKEAFPTLEVETRDRPDVSGEHDLYFIDNQFDGRLLAGKLAKEVRGRNPGACIVAFSASLDSETLKSLLNTGCDGAFDKAIPTDLSGALAMAGRYILRRRTEAEQPPSEVARGPRGVFQSIGRLLTEWNHRLDREETRSAAGQ